MGFFFFENLALCRSTQRPFANFMFFLLLCVVSPKPLFLKCFRDFTKRDHRKMHFSETSKNQGQKTKKLCFDIFALVFFGGGGPKTPFL